MIWNWVTQYVSRIKDWVKIRWSLAGILNIDVMVGPSLLRYAQRSLVLMQKLGLLI